MGPSPRWSLVKFWLRSAKPPPPANGKKVLEVYELEKKYLEVKAKRILHLKEGLSKSDGKIAKLLEQEQALLTALNNFWGSGR